MNDAGEAITLRIHGAIAEIAAEDWDACAGDINPTVSHGFLNAMEESGSVRPRRTPARRRAALSEEPFLRRIRVRLGLG